MCNNHNRKFNYLLLMLTVFVGSSLLFLEGFFQVSNNKKRKSGEQFFDNVQVKALEDYMLHRPPIKYEKIILMIIDAWRADYPNVTTMPYAHESACNHFRIKVDIPTVTMPRIKSITTGTISNFIDIVFNLGHSPKLEESILHSLTEKNKKSVFAGDRTWYQLFPGQFYRSSFNMDSLYVNDFYEGDLNVSKTLMKELKYTDWHLMILHYLGLDHIGHVEGSHSEKIYLKLLEMDNVIKHIVANMHSKTLLLVTGDHGMRNGGSHGGSDTEELYVPLMAFESNCVKKGSVFEHRQIDMTATLAVLMDVKIPSTSIGCLIPEMLEDFSYEEQLYFFHYNALHLMGKIKTQLNSVEEDYLSWYKEAEASHKDFISNKVRSSVSFEKAKQNYIRVSKKISQTLSQSMVQYNMPQILIALFLAALCASNLLINVLFDVNPNSLQTNQFSWKKCFVCAASAVVIYCIIFFAYVPLTDNNILALFISISSIALSIYFAIDVFKIGFAILIPPLSQNGRVILKLSIPPVLLVLFLCHTFSLSSSSYVEEEHQTWYYFTPSLLLVLTIQNFYIDVKNSWKEFKPVNVLFTEFWHLRHAIVVMLTLIGCRRLNQTGNKWRHIIDVGDVLTRTENHFYLIFIFITGLVFLLLLLKKHNAIFEMCFCCLALLCTFLYREILSHSFILILFLISLFCTQSRYWKGLFFKHKRSEHYSKGSLIGLLEANLTCSVLTSALLHRPHNVILLPALLYTLEKSYFLCDSLHINKKRDYSRCYVMVLKTVVTIFIANTFYFFQGNSNSLATIDLNAGYIGLTSYNPFVVGSLVTINTYSAPINAFLYLILHMFSTQRSVLPMRQEKDEATDVQLLESTEEDLYLVYSLFTTSTIMPVTVYWCLLVGFRYHLFIYSVFAPKAFYQCFQLLVFYLNFILTNLYFRQFLK